MISPRVQDAINEQIMHEFYSSYVYLSMSAHFERAGLPGFAHWMRLQADEEHDHAMRLYDHLNDRGGTVVLQAIKQPPAEFGSPVEVFQAALEHERRVTALIHDLYKVAVEEKDYPAEVELQWFITEQVEEEKSAGEIVDKLKLAGDHNAAILMLDQELGRRQPEDHD